MRIPRILFRWPGGNIEYIFKAFEKWLGSYVSYVSIKIEKQTQTSNVMMMLIFGAFSLIQLWIEKSQSLKINWNIFNQEMKVCWNIKMLQMLCGLIKNWKCSKKDVTWTVLLRFYGGVKIYYEVLINDWTGLKILESIHLNLLSVSLYLNSKDRTRRQMVLIHGFLMENQYFIMSSVHENHN